MLRAKGVAGCQENLSPVQGLRASIVSLSVSGELVVVSFGSGRFSTTSSRTQGRRPHGAAIEVFCMNLKEHVLLSPFASKINLFVYNSCSVCLANS